MGSWVTSESTAKTRVCLPIMQCTSGQDSHWMMYDAGPHRSHKGILYMDRYRILVVGGGEAKMKNILVLKIFIKEKIKVFPN